jgi:hypothetical protein
MAPLRLRIDGRTFRDSDNREVTLHGINCAADAKFPANPDQPSHVVDNFFDGDNVSFVNRPFSVDDAATHFARLRGWGYNTIRYVFTWEAIEHAGPGRYDEEWIQHTISVLRVAKGFGFYIFMDPHQDVVCRLSKAESIHSVHSSDLLASGHAFLEAQERRSGPYMLVDSTPNPLMSPKQLSFIMFILSQTSFPR